MYILHMHIATWFFPVDPFTESRMSLVPLICKNRIFLSRPYFEIRKTYMQECSTRRTPQRHSTEKNLFFFWLSVICMYSIGERGKEENEVTVSGAFLLYSVQHNCT